MARRPQQTFTRLPVPQATGDVQSAVSDIYDKLAQIPASISTGFDTQIAALAKQLAALTKDKAAASTPAALVPSTPAPASSLQYAFIPALTSLPSAIPGSSVYAQDGLLIEITGSPASPGQFYRYDALSLSWAGPFGGGGRAIVDTHGNRVNFPAISNGVGATYAETDRQAFYYDNATDWALISGQGRGVFADMYADLTTLDLGYMWITTDRGNVVYYWDGAVWNYVEGEEDLTLTDFTARTFTAEDAGYIVNITDYEHRIRWDGTNWSLMAGDPGSKYIVASADGTAPLGGVWQACDGTIVDVFTIVAGVPGVTSITTPDLLTGQTFLRGGAYTGAVDPSTPPTFSSGGFTASNETATHTHPLTSLALGTESASHAHNPASTANVQAYLSGIPIVVGFGTTGTELALHTHALVSGDTDVENATHTHTITGSGSISAPVVGAGTPDSLALLWYMRR